MNEYIAVDFDGTLATLNDKWNADRTATGDPIPAMVQRVKGWLQAGLQVKIFTARVSPINPDFMVQHRVIQAWLQQHLGIQLEITSDKSPHAIEYWDDRAITVIPDTGLINVSPKSKVPVPINMDPDTKAMTVCIVDNGLFVSWAIELTKYFGRVLYHFKPWKTAYPKSVCRNVGHGLPGVERVEDLFSIIPEVDLFIFTDIYHGDLQVHLESLGKLVWGNRMGEHLEMYRKENKELKKSIGMAVAPYQIVVGMDALEVYCKDPKNENKFIKISVTRGDCETFHHCNWIITKPILQRIAVDLGPAQMEQEFIIEDPIESDMEIGYDGYSVDGMFPQIAIQGYEIKDAGLISAVVPYQALPDIITKTNAAISPVLSAFGCRGFCSFELRRGKQDQKFYSIDDCMRCGSPPSELYQAQYTNWGKILTLGAQGIMALPDAPFKYGVEVMINTKWGDKNDQPVCFPPEILDFVKLKFSCRYDGVYHCLPQDEEIGQIGAVIGLGNSIIEAIAHCKKNADQIEAHDIDIRFDSIPAAVKEIALVEKKYGYKFGDGKIPTPEEVSEVI